MNCAHTLSGSDLVQALTDAQSPANEYVVGRALLYYPWFQERLARASDEECAREIRETLAEIESGAGKSLATGDWTHLEASMASLQ